MKPKSQLVKRYVKLLALLRDPNQQVALLKKAPEQVIKSICDAALNAQQGDIRLSKSVKKTFAKKRELFHKLTSRSLSIPKKRRLLVQRGGFAILPLLLSTVLGTIGSALFSK
jgi:ABC-type methionine transport system ATPase subunit